MAPHLFRVARAPFSTALLLVVLLLVVVSCSGDAETSAQDVEVAVPTSTALPTPEPPEAQATSTPIPTVAPATPTPLPTAAPTEVPAAAPAENTAQDTAAAPAAAPAEEAAPADATTATDDQPAPASSADESQAGRCLLGDVELPVPAGWSQSGCQSFAAVADFATAGDCPCQYPIDAVISQQETWEAATVRIQGSASYAISGSSDRTVGGKPARVYDAQVVNEQGQRLTQTVAIIDLSDAVLFLAATQDAATQPDGHTWDATRAAFFGMLDGTVIDGVRTVTDVPADAATDPVPATEPGTDTSADDTADTSTDVTAEPAATPTAVASDPAATDSGCPALPAGGTGTPSIIDLNADGRNEVILPNALTGDGLKYELYSHAGDCAWVSNLQLIDRQSVEPRLSFVCRPNPDGGWYLVEQTRDDNPNGGERVTDQLYLFDGVTVFQSESFVYQLDDTTLVFGSTARFAPLQAGDRELCR